jgi:hypothetical protein
MTTSDASMTVPERALRARRLARLWVDPGAVTGLLSFAMMWGMLAFRPEPLAQLKWWVPSLLFSWGFGRSLRGWAARVGAPRHRYKDLKWSDAAVVTGLMLPVALVAGVASWNPSRPVTSVTMSVMLAVPVAREVRSWWQGRWSPRLALAGLYAAVIGVLLLWPLSLERGGLPLGMVLMSVELAVSAAFNLLEFETLTRAVQREADGDTV